MKPIKAPALSVTQGDSTFFLTKLPAGLLAQICYTAVRNRDTEDGAVQRVLNSTRIASIRDFTLRGGTYPGCIILNWVDRKNDPKFSGNSILVQRLHRTAQIIDGQHRLAGIQAAMEKRASIAKLELPVAMFVGLDNQGCADIFLSINTKQRTVPKTLVYDLFGVASDLVVDAAAERATDLARVLNEDEDSPYFDRIKFANSPRSQKGIALSTIVDALKPLVDDIGVFEKVGLPELESQTRAVINYFTVLREAAGEDWDDSDNAMLYAAGFTGAIEFFRDQVVPYCNVKRSFKATTIRKAFTFKQDKDVIRQGELKGLQGRAARNKVFQALADRFEPAQKPDIPIEV
ncbi:MAG: DGQHR domain-containing protein [Phycisphaerales bacterium]|nr:DGQHR domain-containing protein [Phycisphaerales bacterium]